MRMGKYNAFKMWGSWAGTLAGFMILMQGIGMRGDGVQMDDLLLGPLMYLIPGFLIGWGIHSLFRRFRK